MVSAKRKLRARTSGYDRQMGKGDQRQVEAFESSSGSSFQTSHAALHPRHVQRFRGEQKVSLIHAMDLLTRVKGCVG